MFTIYKYINCINGKVYIGRTSQTLEQRAQKDGYNYRECRRFYEAICKYSWQAFQAEVLDTASTTEEADRKERYYISLYRSADPQYGYNLMFGRTGVAMCEETKELLSQKAIIRYRDTTSNPMYGKQHSEETKARQRENKLGKKNPMYGTTWTDIQRDRCGVKGKKLTLTQEQRDTLRDRAKILGATTGLRSVRCVEDNETFSSIKEAAARYGVSKSTLCGHLTGKQKTCKGKHFEYINNTEGATTIEKRGLINTAN